MDEKNEKRGSLERAKEIMQMIDPALLSAALNEIMLDADEAEEDEAARIKGAIREIYDSIPEGKNKASIVSKAIKELDSDILEREISTIKESLAEIDMETIMQAAKDFIDIDNLSISCQLYLIGCKYYIIKPCAVCITYKVNPCLNCIKYIIFPCKHYCLKYAIYEYPKDWLEIDPPIKEQLKEEIIQEVLQRPELSRAMNKMIRKIQDKK